jgi:hypothetical protein
MTDIIIQVNNLPQDIKTHMYSFIHIEDRVKIMMEQYYDKLISNNSIWYQFVNHLDEEILEIFYKYSYDIPDKFGHAKTNMYLSKLNNYFPTLNETIYFSHNKLQKTRHPFYDDLNCFIRRGFKICVDKGRFSSRRYKSYKHYLIDNRVNIKKNFENQYDLFSWKTYNNAFDKKYLELVFNHLKTVLISIHRPSISKKIKNAIEEVENSERVKVEKQKENNKQNMELMSMRNEERLSRNYQKKMNLQTRRLLREQKLQQLELESTQRKADRIAKREANELYQKQIKQAKSIAILNKKYEKENSRKLREKLARQRKQDCMLASTTKLMRAMFTIKIQKPRIDRKSQKALKEKLKRQKEYDRVDKEILKAMQAIFKTTKKRTSKSNAKTVKTTNK